MRVFVYFNLHRKLWSIKALEGPHKGRVLGHASYLDLRDVQWKVSEAGRQRVLRERKKNVHAGAVGTLDHAILRGGICLGKGNAFTTRYTEHLLSSEDAPINVSYNPYKAGTFVNKDTGEALHKSDAAFFAAAERAVWAFN